MDEGYPMSNSSGRVFRSLLLVSMLSCLLVGSSTPFRVMGYSPVVGHQTRYDYGFINTHVNESADDIGFFTGLTLSESNYTMLWHQHVNLTITVEATSVFEASYNFSVVVHSNVVVISNSSPWETQIILNGSAVAPSPTGVMNQSLQYPLGSGLPGFFLDDLTLTSISLGSNIIIGDSLWQTITATTYTVGGGIEPCYLLQNETILPNVYYMTQHVIDQDVGIYFSTNETQILTYDNLQETITYYFRVLSTTVALLPPPNPLLFMLLIVLIVVIVITVFLFLWRFISRRRRRAQLPTESDAS
jgi:hypothetical protein